MFPPFFAQEEMLDVLLQLKAEGATADEIKAEGNRQRISLQPVPSGLQVFGGSRALRGAGDYICVSLTYERVITLPGGLL